MFRLEVPRRYRLTRAPLAQALVQVRFPLIARLQTPEGIAPVQDRLRSRYPYMAQRQEVALQLVPPPATPGAAVVGGLAWELTDDDGRLVVISTGTATLVVGSAYEGVEDFTERFLEVLNVLKSEADVPRCDRLGTRYLSVADTVPGAEGGWKAWFRPELTGWVASDVLDGATRAEVALSQVQLRGASSTTAGSHVLGSVQHGFVPPGSTIPGLPPVTTSAASYILSIDLAVDVPQPFEPPALRGQFEALHAEIDAFFRWSLAPGGEEHFGLEELR